MHLISNKNDEEENWDMLHHETVYTINQYLEAQSVLIRNDNSNHEILHSVEPQEMIDLNHSICKVDIEYYSINKNHKFMIVKTIEEMEDHKQFKFVIQTIRVLTEQFSNDIAPNENVPGDFNENQGPKVTLARFK